jgi:hypothetical protein
MNLLDSTFLAGGYIPQLYVRYVGVARVMNLHESREWNKCTHRNRKVSEVFLL